MESQRLPLQKGQQSNLVSISSGSVENWGESAMADASPRTDISTDVDTDDKVQRVISLSLSTSYILHCINWVMFCMVYLSRLVHISQLFSICIFIYSLVHVEACFIYFLIKKFGLIIKVDIKNWHLLLIFSLKGVNLLPIWLLIPATDQRIKMIRRSYRSN